MFSIEDILTFTKGRLYRAKGHLRVWGVSTDSRNVKRGEAFIALRGRRFDGHDFIFAAAKRGARALIIEERYYKKNKEEVKKMPANIICIIVANTLVALGDLALAARNRFRLPIIAVTGSSGKTTSKEMIAHVLTDKYRTLKNQGTENNLIGVPLNLLRLNADHQLACLELGMSYPGEIARLTRIVKPTLGVITNIGHAHLENLKTKQAVFKEKSKLLTGLKFPAISLINYDDPCLVGLANKFKKVFSFGIKGYSDFSARDVAIDKYGISFKLARTKQRFAIRTFGVHNVYNALIAIAVGVIFGLDLRSIAKRLNYFKNPSGRFNIISCGRLRIIDDSYNANPLSLKYALQSIRLIKTKGRKILVFADMLELGSQARRLHRQVAKILQDSDIDFILTNGRLAAISAEACIKSGFKKSNIYQSQSLSELKSRLSFLVRGQDLVLVKGSRAMHMERIVNFLRKINKR